MAVTVHCHIIGNWTLLSLPIITERRIDAVAPNLGCPGDNRVLCYNNCICVASINGGRALYLDGLHSKSDETGRFRHSHLVTEELALKQG